MELEPLNVSLMGLNAFGAAPNRDRNVFSMALDAGTLVLVVLAGWALFDRIGPGDPSGSETSSAGLHTSVMRVSGITVENAQGGTVRLFADENPTAQLLFVFRSDCPACAMEKPQWAKLAATAAKHDIPVIALTTEPLEQVPTDYFGERGAVPVVSVQDPARLPTALGTAVVPTTMLVSEDRSVRFRAMGVMSGPALDSIGRLLAHGKADDGGHVEP